MVRLKRISQIVLICVSKEGRRVQDKLKLLGIRGISTTTCSWTKTQLAQCHHKKQWPSSTEVLAVAIPKTVKDLVVLVEALMNDIIAHYWDLELQIIHILIRIHSKKYKESNMSFKLRSTIEVRAVIRVSRGDRRMGLRRRMLLSISVM